MKGITSYFWGSTKPEKVKENNEVIELVQTKSDQAKQPSKKVVNMKAELLSTEKTLLQILEQVKSNPELMKKVIKGLDPNDSHYAHATQLLSKDLTSSKILLSDEKKAEEWFVKVQMEDKNQPKQKNPWRYYHIVTVPAKYTWKGAKCIHKGYRFCSELVVPLAVGAIVIQSPWLPILRMLLGKVL